MIPKKLSSKTIYSCKYLDLCLDKVKFPTDKIVEDYHILKIKHDSVVIILMNNNRDICFVNSPRYATQKIELELPAGSIEEGETILEAGKREVLEETGYLVKNLKHIYTFNPANSISNQKAHILLGIVKSNKPSQEFNRVEVSSVEWLTKEKIKKLISSNEIMDGFSMIAVLLYYYLENV